MRGERVRFFCGERAAQQRAEFFCLGVGCLLVGVGFFAGSMLRSKGQFFYLFKKGFCLWGVFLLVGFFARSMLRSKGQFLYLFKKGFLFVGVFLLVGFFCREHAAQQRAVFYLFRRRLLFVGSPFVGRELFVFLLQEACCAAEGVGFLLVLSLFTSKKNTLSNNNFL